MFGIGLVVGLDGTGGDAPPGPYRSVLEDQLPKENKIDNRKAILGVQHDVAGARVGPHSGRSARKDDIIDINISVPKESRTTSLRGGRLLRCQLYDYSTKKGLSPSYKGLDVAVRGKPVAKAEGNVSVGFGDGDEQARLRVGRIWGGGRCAMPRPLYLHHEPRQHLREHHDRSAPNESTRLSTASRRASTTELATAKDKRVVYHQRAAPIQAESASLHSRGAADSPVPDGGSGPDCLLASTRRTVAGSDAHDSGGAAAGSPGARQHPTLKHGLTSEHPLVRFTSAEALAYLGSTTCGEELVEAGPRATSLAGILFDAPWLRWTNRSATSNCEICCRSRRRKRAMAPSTPCIRSTNTTRPFAANSSTDRSGCTGRRPESSPMVHLATITRAEVVIFGEEPVMNPPFPILAGEFTVTAKKGDDRCTITHASLRSGKTQKQCSLKLEDVIRTMGEMGALYPDIVELLRRADKLQCLSCQVAVDAMPQVTEVYDLAKAAAAGDAELLKTHPEILAAKAEFGANPTLFQQTTRTSATDKETEAVLSETLSSKPQ